MAATFETGLTRRVTRRTLIGDVVVGAGAPIVVQSMTNTDTADAERTARQAAALAAAGSELVRITVNTHEAAKAVPEVVKRLDGMGVRVPVIGDFHYNGHILLTQYPECARSLAKYRINPGNVGVGKRHDENFRQMIQIALDNGKPVRIGVNWGSLDQALLTRLMDENVKRPEPKDARGVLMEAMVRSALESALMAEEYGLPRNQIILSAKVSGVQDLLEVYRTLAGLGWRPGPWRYLWLAVLIPIVYCCAIYLPVWLIGLGALDGRTHSEELMVLCAFLDDLLIRRLEHDEVPQVR